MDASGQRRALILLALLTVSSAGLWILASRSAIIPDIPARSAAELAAMTDQELENACVRDLSRQVYAADAPRSAGWRSLTASGQALWVAIAFENRLRSGDVNLVMIQQALKAGADLPDFSEVQASCKELGFAKAAAHMGEVIRIFADHPIPGPAEHESLARLQASWLAEIGSPVAQRTRLAYIRSHLSDLVSP